MPKQSAKRWGLRSSNSLTGDEVRANSGNCESMSHLRFLRRRTICKRSPRRWRGYSPCCRRAVRNKMLNHEKKEEFKKRVLDWADRLGVKVRTLSVRPMRNKWASCSTSGNLNFNSELLALDKRLVDYVVVHELLHFSVPNHGKLWKSLMRAHIGDYEELQNQLPVKESQSRH